MTAISVVFCSRGRPDSLARALCSMYEHAAEPDEVEVIVAVDPDDIETIGATDGNGPLGSLNLPRQAGFWVAPERYGYTGLHLYLNQLAKMAKGTWCLWFNDDMIMQTPGWDTVIRANRPAILWPKANHVHHANIVPAWPRAWSDAIGHVSPTSHMDTYLQWLGDTLGRHDRIPVEVLHDRADVTGGHDDQTYAEGRKLLGPEGMVPGFDAAAVREQIETDARIIRGLL